MERNRAVEPFIVFILIAENNAQEIILLLKQPLGLLRIEKSKKPNGYGEYAISRQRWRGC
ncbi:MAG: hypothetical protein ACK4NF_06430 [Planctomycetota bacterium]